MSGGRGAEGGERGAPPDNHDDLEGDSARNRSGAVDTERARHPTGTGSPTIGRLLAAVAAALAGGGVDDTAAEARELVAALLDVPRSWPLLHRAEPVDGHAWAQALAAARRRAAGAPLAYAVRRASFRQLTLDVDERVLIPRPETEQLVELVLRLERGRAGGTVVDVGTGSGAIAIALACEGAFDRVVAVDISLDALAVARHNAVLLRGALRAPVEFHHGSLLDPLGGDAVRCIVSNPPYIAYGEAAALPASVRNWEPAVALFSGAEGMDATARLVRQAASRLEARGLLALEVDARRASLAAELLAADGRYDEVSVQLDLAGRERFVTGRRR